MNLLHVFSLVSCWLCVKSQSLTAHPLVLAKSGDVVSLSWTGVSAPNASDSIQFSIGANPEPMGALPVTLSATWQQGKGTVAMPLVNNHPLKQTSVTVKFQDYDEITHLHLAMTHSDTEMRIQFTSNQGSTPFVELQELNASGPTGPIRKFFGTFLTYTDSDMCNAPANSTKGFIDVGYFHDVLLSGLKNSQLYQYRVGVGHALKSAWVPFVSSPRVGSAETVSFLAYGDQGVFSPFEHLEFWQKLGVEQQQAAAQTVAIMQRFVAEGVPGVNASQSAELDHQTHRRLASRWGARRGAVQPSPRMILHIGDISYARGLGVLWEYFMSSVANAAASAPYMVGIGNHEFDFPQQAFKPKGSDYGDDSLGECGIPYAARFHMPPPVPGQAIPWRERARWYSFDYGAIHFVIISTEHDFTAQSAQYQWIAADLASVDRQRTPWLTLMGHRPLYTSAGGPNVGVLTLMLRAALEPLIHAHKVDVVLYGHVHCYERTCGIVKDTTCGARDEDGAVHLVVGGGGNNYITGWDTDEFAGHKIQPKWSVFRTVNHGISEFRVNRTHLEMIFIGSQRAEVHDRLILRK